MVRYGVICFVFVTLLAIGGCGASGQQTAGNNDWHRKNTEAFDRQRAEHVKESSKAVRGYQQFRNR